MEERYVFKCEALFSAAACLPYMNGSLLAPLSGGTNEEFNGQGDKK